MRPRLTSTLLVSVILASSITPLAFSQVGEPIHLDFLLVGNETRVVEALDISVNGDVVIGDNSTLKLVNSQLNFTEDSHGIRLSGYGRLELVNTTIRFSLASMANLTAIDQSLVILRDSSVMNQTWCSLHNKFHYHHLVDIKDSAGIDASRSKIGYLRLNDNSNAKVRDSFIGNLEYNRSNCSVMDTTIDIVGFVFRDAVYDCKIKQVNDALDGLSRFETSGVPGIVRLEEISIQYASFISSLNSSLTLRDSRIDLINSDSDITLLRTTVSRLFPGGNSTVEILDSAVEFLGESYPGIKRIHIANSSIIDTEFSLTGEADIESSRIGVWMPSYMHYPNVARTVKIRDSTFGNFTLDSNTTYLFSNVRVVNYTFCLPGFSESDQTSIMGGVEFSGFTPLYSAYYPENIFSVIKREYVVTLIGGGAPRGGAHLSLSRGGEVIWSGSSDDSGSARFNLTFARIRVVDIPGSTPLVDVDNVTTPLSLSVEYGGDSFSRAVSIQGETPIVVEFSGLTRFQRQQVAVIMIIVLVLGICIMFPRHLKWLRGV